MKTQIDISKNYFEGFEIEKTTDANNQIAYKLHGKRGKVINLVKNQNEIGLFFMINAKTWNEENINGYSWVKEINGKLKLIKII